MGVIFRIALTIAALFVSAQAPGEDKGAPEAAGGSKRSNEQDADQPPRQIGTPDAAVEPALPVITNPNPDNHPRFTAALGSPHLYWADSLRPGGSVEDQTRYYGLRRLGGNKRKSVENPRVTYDPAEDAALQTFVVGEKGQRITYQTRIEWPAIGPEDADLVSVQWQVKMSECGVLGGKQFQIATTKDNLHFEYKWLRTYGEICSPDWGGIPSARVYSTRRVGGRGLHDMLVGGTPESCKGIFRCPQQPALPHVNPKRYSATDHVRYEHGKVVGGDAFVARPNIWITITVTFDWRDPSEHKIWMHMEDEETPKTLVIGTDLDGDGWGDDGYPVTFKENKADVTGFWLEFNNSSTVNSFESHVWVRNLVVFRDAFVP